MPYPEDEAFFSIYDSPDKLGELGEGFPVFFYLMKYMTILLLLLTAVFFVPTVYCMSKVYGSVKDNLTVEDDELSMFSFGMFERYGRVMDATANKNNLTSTMIYQTRENYVEIVTGALMTAIFVTLIGSIILRRRLLQKAIMVDVMATTPSDFALLGHCPEFNDDCDFSKEMIEKEVEAHFREDYGIDGIEYVNIALDIHDLYDVTATLEANMK